MESDSTWQLILLLVLLILEDCDTISGFIISELGYFPEAYDILESDGLKFEILEVGKNRIERLKILS